jgi:hypothetical protein
MTPSARVLSQRSGAPGRSWRAALLFACALAARALADPPGAYTLDVTPDSLSRADSLGLAARNENVAGENGWVRADSAGGFQRGDGAPLRFWAATSDVQARLGIEDLRAHARELARRGLNMIRHHGHVNPGAGQPLSSVNEKEIGEIQRVVAAFKQEGIYVTYSPYWARTARGLIGPETSEPWGALFFDPALQRAYKAWLRAALLRPNPYDARKLPLARDPALAVFQIQNEDSLLFWTAEKLDAAQRGYLSRRYQSWRRDLGLRTPQALELNLHDLERASASRRESVRFLADTMRAWNREVVQFLRQELGYQGLVNAGNWKTADDERLLDLERWSYSPGEIVASNRYVHGGPHLNLRVPRRARFAIDPNDLFQDRSALLAPERLPLRVRQLRGRPFLVTESGWVAPMSYRAEGPLAVAAFASLLGIDGFYWFRMHQVGFDRELQKWGSASPDVLAGWPAAALMFRRGDVRAGTPVVTESRSEKTLFALEPARFPEGASFDPNRDAAWLDSAVPASPLDPLAFLVGPVVTEIGAPKDSLYVADLSAQIDRRRRRLVSNTGEIRLDWEAGVLSVDTPRAQGAAGFLARRSPLQLGALRIETRSEYLAVVAVSLDDLPLRSSARILVQVTTRARPRGWRTEGVTDFLLPDGGRFSGQRILAVGRPPWAIWPADVRLTLRNARIGRAALIDAFLNPTGGQARVSTTSAGAEIQLPPDAAYVVLTAP